MEIQNNFVSMYIGAVTNDVCNDVALSSRICCELWSWSRMDEEQGGNEVIIYERGGKG